MTKVVEHGDVREYDPHHFITEASTLELPPGWFPISLETKIGNGQNFQFVSTTRTPDEAIVHVDYRQEFGCAHLRIIND